MALRPSKDELLHIDDGISAFAVSKGGAHIAVGTSGMAAVYTADSMKHIVSFVLSDASLRVTNLAFSFDANKLVIQCEAGKMYQVTVSDEEAIQFLD